MVNMLKSSAELSNSHLMSNAIRSLKTDARENNSRRISTCVWTTAVAIVCSIAVFAFDLVSTAHASIGVLYFVMLVLINGHPARCILAFSGVASLLLLVDLFIFAGTQVDELIIMDKYFSLIAIAVFTFGILRHRKVHAHEDSQELQA
jgi:hypothetical protein